MRTLAPEAAAQRSGCVPLPDEAQRASPRKRFRIRQQNAKKRVLRASHASGGATPPLRMRLNAPACVLATKTKPQPDCAPPWSAVAEAARPATPLCGTRALRQMNIAQSGVAAARSRASLCHRTPKICRRTITLSGMFVLSLCLCPVGIVRFFPRYPCPSRQSAGNMPLMILSVSSTSTWPPSSLTTMPCGIAL